MCSAPEEGLPALLTRRHVDEMFVARKRGDDAAKSFLRDSEGAKCDRIHAHVSNVKLPHDDVRLWRQVYFGDGVEYFSRTRQQWIPALIKSDVKHSEDGSLCLDLNSRSAVPLREIRLKDEHRLNPRLLQNLHPGDAVEVFDVEQSQWLCAHVLQPPEGDHIHLTLIPEATSAACSQTQVDQTSIGFVSPDELVQVLLQGDIRLVRGEFLEHLVSQGRAFPRRQEAEMALAPSGKTALVSWGEIQREACLPLADRQTDIVCVSHCWESREHPDPFRYQLEEIARCPRLRQSWFFIDYMCLYQYPRTIDQQTSFKLALDHIHLLYSHDCTNTMFIDELTPEIKEQRCEESVEVFCESSGQLDWVKLAEPAELIDKEGQSSPKMLVMNQTPYVQRGWCVAEQEWSATRNSMSKPPTRPEDFERKAANGHLKFTHRSDLDLVLKLQKLVFLQKITNCTCYFYSDSVWDTHVSVFVGILPCFVSLRELRISVVDLSKDFHEENLAIALANLPMLEKLDLYCILTKQRGVFLAKALKNMKLRVLSLQHCSLDDTGYAALAESLETHPTLKFLLAGNNPRVRSYCFGGPGPEILRLTKHMMSANVTAKLAAALHCNSSLERVLLTDRFMGRSREEILGLFMDNR
ncbi:unnamed protein product, partial [Symbiodinium necroappetens]